jgi:XapX domain-containing protein
VKTGNMDFVQIILALAAGIILGGAFTLLNFPLPAPDSIAGVMGVVGVFAGMILVKYFVH